MRRIKNTETEKENSRKGALLLAIYCAYQIFVLTFNELVFRVVGATKLDTAAVLLAVLLAMIYSSSAITDMFKIEDLVFWSVAVTTVCISCILHPLTQRYIQTYAFQIITLTVIPYFAARCVRDAEDTVRPLKIGSVVSVACAIIFLILATGSKTFTSEEMSFSYYLCTPTIYLLYSWTKDKKWWELTLFAAGIVIMFISGSRGPLLCVVVFVILYILFNVKSVATVVTALVVMGGGVAFCTSDALYTVLAQLDKLLTKMHIDSRLIMLFMESRISSDSYRSKIKNVVIQAIQERPFFGNGVMGDWVVTEGIFFNERGTYVHNIFLEMWCQYGVLIGSAILFMLVVLTIKAFKCVRNKEEQGLLLIFASVGLTKSLFSSTYLFSTQLMLFVGYALTIVLREKYKGSERLKNGQKSD